MSLLHFHSISCEVDAPFCSDKYGALRALTGDSTSEEPAPTQPAGDWGTFSTAPSDAPSAVPDLLSSSPGATSAAVVGTAPDGWSSFETGQPSGGPETWANFSTAFNSQLKIIDLTQKADPSVPAPQAPAAAPPVPVPTASHTPPHIGPPKMSRGRRGKTKSGGGGPGGARSTVRIAADIELPPSEEKHDFMDEFAREDFGAILTSSSASTSEDYAELSSQASYEATTTSSSPSSLASASPRHTCAVPQPSVSVPVPPSVPSLPHIVPAVAPEQPEARAAARLRRTDFSRPPAPPHVPTAPDLAWRDEPPPLDCVEEDDFGDFQVSSVAAVQLVVVQGGVK